MLKGYMVNERLGTPALNIGNIYIYLMNFNRKPKFHIILTTNMHSSGVIAALKNNYYQTWYQYKVHVHEVV